MVTGHVRTTCMLGWNAVGSGGEHDTANTLVT